ncbi:hypothetical protein J4416_05120 [Candidatus Pacearchaeota archaeon]|nr:hypothetical protein [Candidatus Pacearchaeota archaeon]
MGKSKLVSSLTALVLAGCVSNPQENHPPKYEVYIDSKGNERRVPMIWSEYHDKYVINLGSGIVYNK